MAKTKDPKPPQIVIELPKTKHETHPNTLKNLKPFFKPGNPWAWKPGQSGNPHGAGARKPITDLYRKTITEKCEHPQILKALGLPEGATWGNVLALAAFARASQGDIQAIREITDRVDGPVQKLAQEEPLETGRTSVETLQVIVRRVRARIAAANDVPVIDGNEVSQHASENPPPNLSED
jgi:hypothetical protein